VLLPLLPSVLVPTLLAGSSIVIPSKESV